MYVKYTIKTVLLLQQKYPFIEFSTVLLYSYDYDCINLRIKLIIF